MSESEFVKYYILFVYCYEMCYSDETHDNINKTNSVARLNKCYHKHFVLNGLKEYFI